MKGILPLGYVIREIDNLAEFHKITDAWDDCLSRSCCDTMFLTSSWLQAWWQGHGHDQTLRIICVFADDRLVAGAPLCIRKTRYYLTPTKETRFVGDLAADRQDFLALPDHPQAIAAIWERLRCDPRGCQIFRLEEIPVDSPNLAMARQSWHRVEIEPSSTLPYLSIRTGWDSFEATLSRKFCSQMRNRFKLFNEWGTWRYDVCEGPASLAQLDEAIAVEAASPKAAAGRAFFADAGNRVFMRHLLASPGSIRPLMFTLRLDGRLISYILGFVYRGVYHAYTGAYLHGYEKGSVGKWLFHQTVKFSFDQGLAGFDFLRGPSFLKTRWRPDQERRHVRAVAFAPGIRSSLLRIAVFRLRPWLKRNSQLSKGVAVADTDTT